jgi:putative ABC transport system permease protein
MKAHRRTFWTKVQMARQLVVMAMRNIMRNSRRSLLSALMVAAGMAAILFAKSYLAGVRVLIEEGVIHAGIGALQVLPEGYLDSQEMTPLSIALPEDPQLVQQVRSVENVQAVSPRMVFMGMMNSGDVSTAVRAFGIDPSVESEICPQGPSRPSDRLTGSPLTTRDGNEVVLGSELARGLHVTLGDTVALLVKTRSGSMDAVDLTVVGTYKYGDPEVDKRIAFMPIGVAQKVLHMKGRVTLYAVAVHDTRRVDETVGQVRSALASGPWATDTQGWGSLEPRYRDMVTLQQNTLGILLFIVFALVLIGIINAMLMSVFERTREIGTLLSMGFSRKRIAALFLCEAFTLGTVSALIGACIGAGLTIYANYKGVPISVPGTSTPFLTRPLLVPTFAAMAIAGAVLGALAGGLWPAIRAARLQPVQALGSH